MFLSDPAACGPCPTLSSGGRDSTLLDDAGRRAVLLGRGDAARFGWDGGLPRGRFRRAIGRMFILATGMEPVSPLADERLERLRLFACMMRRGDSRACAIGELLRADGHGETALHQAVKLALG